MKPYGQARYNREPYDRGEINHQVKKHIDQQLEIWWEGWAEEYYEDIESADTYICDCTMRPDLDYFLKKNEK